MFGFRVCRVLSALLLAVCLTLLAGCMGLSGSQNPENGTTSPNPTPNPGPNPNPTPTPTPTPSNPTATITASPTTVQQGDKVTVSWQTQNATSVTLTQNGTTVQLDGNPVSSSMQFTLNTVGKTTFALTATGAAGTTAATASAAVT